MSNLTTSTDSTVQARPPDLTCGTFSGKDVAARRWLSRLHWDFERAGHQTLDPSQVIRTISMQCDGEAATFLDSTPALADAVDRAENKQATKADLDKLEQALRDRFPARLVDESNAVDTIESLHQKSGEPLAAYYNRAVAVLNSAGCSDRNTSGDSLNQAQQVLLGQIIRQFIKGLHDPALRHQSISMSALTAQGLPEAFHKVKTSQQVLDERKAEEQHKAAASRARMLEAIVAQQNPSVPVDHLLAQQFGQMAMQGHQVGAYHSGLTGSHPAPMLPQVVQTQWGHPQMQALPYQPPTQGGQQFPAYGPVQNQAGQYGTVQSQWYAPNTSDQTNRNQVAQGNQVSAPNKQA
ncbi:hypothetical protein GCG54_00015288 [Colletotrichum gloeosporioides]|uniref:Retrotransposon gag domain-containing protein n=1 Tax=Colletotrichum gloeosporioides TaxID=474922 RepID=A0A8H4FDX6_COLGL|nr:uncharacterized protein GCG54_00015288 [Colletotrichum gloeosporioides]KAF3798305.1 hypothetical protein GCG54_00015288 [Colletotrichum gloeosporioides]